MKLTKYAAMAAAVALMASCSDNGADTPTPEVSYAGKAYMDLKLNLPSQNGGRAATYEDGKAHEYAVDNATLYIFDATSDRCIESVTLNLQNADKDGNDISAAKKQEKVPLEKVTKDGSYKALVILNKDYIKCPTVGQTYAAWASDVQTSTEGAMMKSDRTRFTMVNAMGWAGTTISGDPAALVPFNATNFYYESNDKSAANNNTAAVPVNIFVNRNVAKVSLDNTSAVKVGDTNGTNVTKRDGWQVKLTGWDLNMTNTKSYPIQNVGNKLELTDYTTWGSNDNNYGRLTQGTSFTRINWAIDPNYSSYVADDFEQLTSLKFTSNDTVAYCLENTFNLSNMNKNQSTSVVFSAEFYKGDAAVSFITVDGTIYTVEDLKQLDSESLDELAFAADIASGNLTLETLLGSDKTTQINALKKALNLQDNEEVTFYKDGKCYYNVVIRHFTDTELDINTADWKLPEGGYGTDNKTYLGRYGVVRNNWYELKINSVKDLGEPKIPEPGDTPDDDPDNYMLDLQINILAWAKRSQEVDL